MAESAGSTSNSPVSTGTVIAGKYRVGGVLASGGMGVIVEARHEALDQRVAIKFLQTTLGSQQELRERFLREARAAAKIESDHVVRVFDVGLHDESIPYMVMELLEGSDLSDLAQRGPMPVAEAVAYVTQALEAIVEAHALGIVHRDLKPSNIFIASRRGAGGGRVKVLDFGISKLAPDASTALPDPNLTSTKSMLGSPGYMSPEQVRSSRSVDARSDVWSLGVILYELLAGEPAFVGETLGDIFAKIREEPLPAIRTRRPDVPAALDAILMKCLERDRSQRWPDAASLLEALRPFVSWHAPTSVPDREAHGRPTAAGHDRTVAADNDGAATQAASASRIISPNGPGASTQGTWTGGDGRTRSRAWGAAVVGAVALTGGAFWVMRARDDAAHPTTADTAPPSSPIAATAPEISPPPSAVVPAGPIATASTEPVVSAAPTTSASAAASTSANRTTPVRPSPGARVRPGTPPPVAPAPSPPPPPKKGDDLGI